MRPDFLANGELESCRHVEPPKFMCRLFAAVLCSQAEEKPIQDDEPQPSDASHNGNLTPFLS
jgi:hypothetical protein